MAGSTLPAAHEVCWSLRPPVWVQGLSAAVTLAVATGLATVFSWMNFLAGFFPWAWAMLCMCALAVALIIRAHLNAKRVLCAAPGHWRVLDENGRILLAQAEVLHRWTGPGWMTLRLQGQTPADTSKQRRLNAVIWQASTPPQDWRLLQKWSLRQAARTALAGAAA